jgi:hypothetical protein
MLVKFLKLFDYDSKEKFVFTFQNLLVYTSIKGGENSIYVIYIAYLILKFLYTTIIIPIVFHQVNYLNNRNSHLLESCKSKVFNFLHIIPEFTIKIRMVK